MVGPAHHVELVRLAQITTSWNSKYLSKHHYVSNELFNASAAVEEAFSNKKMRPLLLIISIDMNRFVKKKKKWK